MGNSGKASATSAARHAARAYSGAQPRQRKPAASAATLSRAANTKAKSSANKSSANKSSAKTKPAPAPEPEPRVARTMRVGAIPLDRPYTDYASPAQRAAVRAKARQLASTIGTDTHERGAWIRGDGQQVGPDFGQRQAGSDLGSFVRKSNPGAHVIYLSGYTVEQRMAYRASSIHSHPDIAGGGSFSPTDVTAMFQQQEAGAHVVGRGPDGRVWLYTMRPGPKAGKDGMWGYDRTYRKYHINTIRDRIGAQVDARLLRAMRTGRMTSDQANTLYWHQVWQGVAKELGPDILRYEAGPIR